MFETKQQLCTRFIILYKNKEIIQSQNTLEMYFRIVYILQNHAKNATTLSCRSSVAQYIINMHNIIMHLFDKFHP